MSQFRNLLKYISPPLVWDVYKWVNNKGKFYGVVGDFHSWKEAERFLRDNHKEDYSKPEILNQVLRSIQSVRRGEAVFERDGVIFDKKEYNYPLLATLQRTINSCRKNNKTVHILDFGGSLGSTFFQNRDYLEAMMPYEWHICEQPHFVEIGKKEIPEIKFHEDINSYVESGNPCDILLLSSVIQYFNAPMAWLAKLIKLPFRYIIIDRTLFNNERKDRLAIQYVPPSIYDACYPVWLLNKEFLTNFIIQEGYAVTDEWDSFDRMPVRNGLFSQKIITSKGILFKNKSYE